MTKEELEKEADEYANHNDWFEFSANVDKIGNAIKTKMERAYLAGAEPREKRIAELEKENAELKEESDFYNKERGNYKALYLKEILEKNKTKHNCSNCSAFGKHCPHKVNGDPYHYDCGMTVEDIEKENAKAKELLKQFLEAKNGEDTYKAEWEAEQFLKE